MSETRAHVIQRWFRDTVAARPAALVVATALVVLGLYPGPALVARSPAWQTDAVVNRFSDERAFWLSGLLIIVGPAIVVANLFPDRFDRAWIAVRTRVAALRDRWFIVAVAVFAIIAAATAAVYVMSRKPTTSDEVAQLWHARMLLSGRLWLPPDPNPEFFAIDNVIDRGRWYSQFPIGGPAVFALAMLLHATWLLNPILAGLTVVNVYRFASRAYGAGEARVSALLCATCPFLLLMSGSYMNHTVVAFLTTLALAELPVWVSGARRRQLGASVIIGSALGIAVAVRPLDGAIAALIFGAFVTFTALRTRRVGDWLLVAAAGAIPIAALLFVNSLTTGRPLLFGYEVLWGTNHSLGFHNDPSGNPHTPARALALATVYLTQLNWSLFEWPVAGLAILAGALAVGKLGRWDTVLLAWIGAQIAAYASYWHAGAFLGPRYLFTVVPACLLVAGRGLAIAERSASPAVRRAIVAGVAASLLSAWLIPSTPVGVIGAAESIRPTRLAFKLDLESAVQSLEGTKALVFVSETASSRLMRRMWGLGISRPDAARLAATRDHCALLDTVLDEERRAGSPRDRLTRLERTKAYAPPAGWRLMVTDMAFRTSDVESITPRCRTELLRDGRRETAISYGSTLLENEIGPDGRVGRGVVFVADLGEHNEVLRGRFGDRPWYRLEVPRGASPAFARLTPYE